ncbi:hypothetical protein CYMTET_35086 [Cymbomonas tetramitiformis]|uniref:Rhodanese domain-containing protein n=1 Tax=Cymbomonas tetramitiformis TaxID=36881 RepID=A0AAE0FA00_9CHLO|nr:hypothetical protein CYMTET_35086 [Cymbomonas tetramitiformis]
MGYNQAFLSYKIALSARGFEGSLIRSSAIEPRRTIFYQRRKAARVLHTVWHRSERTPFRRASRQGVFTKHCRRNASRRGVDCGISDDDSVGTGDFFEELCAEAGVRYVFEEDDEVETLDDLDENDDPWMRNPYSSLLDDDDPDSPFSDVDLQQPEKTQTSAYSEEGGFSDIAPRDAFDMLQQNAVVLDIRSAQDYKLGHIAGATHVAFDQLSESVKDGALDHLRERTVVVAGSGDQLSAQAVVRLVRIFKFSDVRELRGGMLMWVAAGLPTEAV